MIGYNRMTGYNKARYNGDGFELSFNDSFTVADDTVLKASAKRLAELIILSGAIAKQQNKSFTDTIKTDDWTRINKDNPDPWSD